MQRDIMKRLVEWKDSKRRKPLILTGVRQCGKTYVLKEFGKTCFKDTCYVNFEESSRLCGIFDFDFDTARILRELEMAVGKKIVPGQTLLILDEVQECPRAITALKYFCENLNELHLVCAGSLLGIALRSGNISFPVGKVNRMEMYPMSYDEFLAAMGGENYINLFLSWQDCREIPELYSEPMKRLLKDYLFVGGMPEAVSSFAEDHDYSKVEEIQKEILADYADDFSKHAPVSEIEKIRMVWSSIPKQLAKENNKFMFSHVKEGKRAHELEGALQWLKNAGLIRQVELVRTVGIPLSSHADATYFKVYMCDIGLLGRQLGLSCNDFLMMEDSDSTAKGAVVENYVLNELVCLGKVPYFWRSGNEAELDFLYEEDGAFHPVEVKAATNTRAKSYRTFCRKYCPRNGFRMSLKNLAVNEADGTRTVRLPLYLVWDMDRLC